MLLVQDICSCFFVSLLIKSWTLDLIFTYISAAMSELRESSLLIMLRIKLNKCIYLNNTAKEW